jgi:hypothetical protein
MIHCPLCHRFVSKSSISDCHYCFSSFKIDENGKILVYWFNYGEDNCCITYNYLQYDGVRVGYGEGVKISDDYLSPQEAIAAYELLKGFI